LANNSALPSSLLAVFDTNPTPMMLYDLASLRFVEVNAAAVKVYGYSRDEFLSMMLKDIRLPEDLPGFHAHAADLLNKRPAMSSVSTRHLRKDGTILHVQIASSHGVPYAGGEVSCAIVFDVTGHVRSLEDLRTAASALEQAQDLGELGYLLADLRTGRVERSPRMLKMLDVSAAEVEGSPLLGVVQPVDPEPTRLMVQAHELNLPLDLTFRVAIRGEDRWWHVVSSILSDPVGTPTHRLVTVHDVTQYQQQAEHLRTMAYTDEVTGLPNRRALFEWRTSQLPASVLLVHLSLVGDLGAKTDDECWRIVSQILGYALPSDAYFYRFTDEIFAVCCSTDEIGAAGIGIAILAAFERPVVVEEQDVLLVVRVGIASTTEPTPVDTLIRNARTALRAALRTGHGVEFHSPTLDRLFERRTTVERRLRTAAFDDSLSVAYQPIVSMLDGRVVGAEALMRWNCEGLGLVSPVEFIPIAEENGMVLSLGDWVLRKACLQARRWQRDGLPLMRMAVNISGRQAERHDFSEIVAQATAAADLSSDYVDLEITETAMMNSQDIAVDNFSVLRSRGFRVSMDDFGTGYSSLSALGTLPVDVVKLDRSFVAEITKNGFTTQVVKGIIDLAHRGGLRVIAEGVETIEQLEVLRALRCDEAQGYLFGHPVPAERFVTDYLKSSHIAGFFMRDPIPLSKEA
jgi:PAS domain S-box-containing protein